MIDQISTTMESSTSEKKIVEVSPRGLEISTLLPILESLLLISGEPLSYARLAKIVGVEENQVREAANLLTESYAKSTERGIMIIENNNQLLLATKPEYAEYIEALTKSTLQENLSKAGLEVLSIIAYRSPITKAEIEAIRGVNCSFTVRNLLLRDLIEREGNPEDSRGHIYRPSFRFLETLGIRSVADLPEYAVLSQDERLKMILEEETSSGESIVLSREELLKAEEISPTVEGEKEMVSEESVVSEEKL